MRVYLRKSLYPSRSFFLAPYLVGSIIVPGIGFQIALSSNTNQSSSNVDAKALYTGGQLGAGLEFRITPKVLLHLDLQGIIRQNLLGDSTTASLEGGLTMRVGVAYFFK